MTQSFSHPIPQSKMAKKLEMETQKLITFFQSNELSLNASKTEFIVFSKTKRTANTQMVVDKSLMKKRRSNT